MTAEAANLKTEESEGLQIPTLNIGEHDDSEEREEVSTPDFKGNRSRRRHSGDKEDKETTVNTPSTNELESFRMTLNNNKNSISDFASHECESEEEIEDEKHARKLIKSAEYEKQGKLKGKMESSSKLKEREEYSRVPEFIAKKTQKG